MSTDCRILVLSNALMKVSGCIGCRVSGCVPVGYTARNLHQRIAEDISPRDGTALVSLDRPRSESVSGTGKASGKDRRSSYTRGLRYEHETEAIFAIPKFEVEFCSEHDMPMTSIASRWVRKRKR